MKSVEKAVAQVNQVVAAGPFAPDWDSLLNYRVPEWFRDSKFGIFIHWGLYSVPAFGNEWYSRNMYVQGSPEFKHHVETYGPQSKFGYKDFIPMFTARHFDAARWARLFKKAGAATSCLWRSITTGSPCTTAAFPSGPPRRWGRSAT